MFDYHNQRKWISNQMSDILSSNNKKYSPNKFPIKQKCIFQLFLNIDYIRSKHILQSPTWTNIVYITIV